MKTFGPVRALDGLDLEVFPGEVHGFLGPNGSGKSTATRIVLGLMKADEGQVTLFGDDPWQAASRLHRRLAYVPGDVALWPGLTGGQCLDILAATHGGEGERRRGELIDRFDLDPTKRSRDYSKGNRQKVALVAALSAEVDFLVLDEPTSGLDPLMEQVFQDVIRERRADGVTVLLSSHILGEVEALADRVTIIGKGRRIQTGTLADLRRHTRTSVHAVTSNEPSGVAVAAGVDDFVAKPVEGAMDARFTVDPDHLDEVVGLLHTAHIQALTVNPPSLDTLFVRSYDPNSTTETAAEGSDGQALRQEHP